MTARTLLLLALLPLLAPASGQTPTDGLDSLCTGAVEARFWSISSGGAIRQWAIVGNNVIGGGEILQGPNGVAAVGLAFCDTDAPSTFHSGSGAGLVYAYADGDWIVEAVTGQVINMGGAGTHLYYTDGTGLLYHHDGTTSGLINDPFPMAFACADVAVDPEGNAYLLVGPDYMTTSVIRVYDPNGAVVTEYPFTLDSFNTYGSFWLNDRLYIARGTMNSSAPNSLLPISFTNDVATAGTLLDFPADGLLDLASCVASASTSLHEHSDITNALTIAPDPVSELLTLNADVSELRIMDLTGREVLHTRTLIAGGINVAHLPAGRYILLAETPQGRQVAQFTKR